MTIYALLGVFNEMKSNEMNKILTFTLKMDHICTLKDVWWLIFDYLYMDMNDVDIMKIMFDVLNCLSTKRNVLGKRTILGKKGGRMDL